MVSHYILQFSRCPHARATHTHKLYHSRIPTSPNTTKSQTEPIIADTAPKRWDKIYRSFSRPSRLWTQTPRFPQLKWTFHREKWIRRSPARIGSRHRRCSLSFASTHKSSAATESTHRSSAAIRSNRWQRTVSTNTAFLVTNRSLEVLPKTRFNKCDKTSRLPMQPLERIISTSQKSRKLIEIQSRSNRKKRYALAKLIKINFNNRKQIRPEFCNTRRCTGLTVNGLIRSQPKQQFRRRLKPSKLRESFKHRKIKVKTFLTVSAFPNSNTQQRFSTSTPGNETIRNHKLITISLTFIIQYFSTHPEYVNPLLAIQLSHFTRDIALTHTDYYIKSVFAVYKSLSA